MKITFSNYALKRMELRNITQKTVVEIVENPDSVISQSEGIRVFSKFIKEENKFYIYRVFVSSDKKSLVIVTVYRTSKIEKYGH